MDAIHPFDSLMPRQIAAKAEDVGVAKGHMDAPTTLLLAILAGAFISMGAVFSTVAATGSVALPFGVGRILAGLAFCLGLILVVVAGAELFTGNNLLLMAFASRKLSWRLLLRNWVLVYLGNMAGAVATALGMYLAALHNLGAGQVGQTMLTIAHGKLELGWGEAFARGVFCNALVCLAVWICMSCRTTGEKVLAIVFPITAFVASGFEHSVANMYFVPAAIFVQDWGPAGAQAAPGLSGVMPLEWGPFVLHNLVPVTLGNIVGGGVLVGIVYWEVYCRRARVV